jgi:hypothetical protein
MNLNCLKILVISVLLLGTSVVHEAQAQRRRDGVVVVVKKPRRTVVVRHYRGLPRYGRAVRTLPRGALVVKHGNMVYHVADGISYQRRTSGYVVVKPVPGLRVRALPRTLIRLTVRGAVFFYHYGVFYTLPQGSDGYEVVEPPVGAVVDALPEGYEELLIDDKLYLDVDGVLYKPVGTDLYEDGTGYEVVSTKN